MEYRSRRLFDGKAMPIKTSVAESTMMMKLIYQYEIERFL
ncbi:hypothetical protein AD05_5320 [Escherichia coli 5-366-08_S4_C2]|nr:hypothetical protein FORC31_p203 [Escherichia coli]EMV43929.1 hypothetical protein ECBCE019MS13_1634 [Escherichia coli BCE019_MS-13]EMV49901.1 hypothetical protein EC2871950_5370 [Escherichia coli 2871950]EMV50313.1 hypothetical protein EC2872000_5277 [Escherichia coli 2872000]EMX19190.1 hypothetical protein ECMP0215661_5038 [Escherichia coli MP021566.1]EMZ50127.1 hypothetical protein EC2846750_5345 [Escherichia coli 2846750]EMZ85643.1 hypothetical protein EC1999001_5142 [Escherichia coli 